MDVLKIGTIIYDKYLIPKQYWKVVNYTNGIYTLECLKNGRIQLVDKDVPMFRWFVKTDYSEKCVRLFYVKSNT